MTLDFSDEGGIGLLPPGTYTATICGVKGCKSKVGNDLLVVRWGFDDGRVLDDLVMFAAATRNPMLLHGQTKIRDTLNAGGKPLRQESPMALMKALVGITAQIEVAHEERNGVRREVVVAVKPLPPSA
jgi:hypothetical protein